MQITITAELIERTEAVPTDDPDKYYYIQNDSHRIVWILKQNAEDLIGKSVCIATDIIHGLKRQKVELPSAGKYLRVLMTKISPPNGTSAQQQLENLLNIAPRNQTTGRKPTIKEAQILKILTSPEDIELARIVGNGNISLGSRRLFQYARQLLLLAPTQEISDIIEKFTRDHQ